MNTTTDSNHIPINNEPDYDKVKMLSCRFALLDLRQQCADVIYDFYNGLSKDKNVPDFSFEWYELKKEFLDILNYYDEGHKLNEDFLLKIKGLNIKNKNIIFVKRLIKLIKITDEN